MASLPPSLMIPGRLRSALNSARTIFGSSDERPYAPSKSEDGYAAMLKGFQWFRFTFREKNPKLVYFVLNVTDRDVPLDVEIFQEGKDDAGHPDVVPFNTGQFIYQVEATQNYPGLYKFRTRVLQPGQEYLVRVAANHPAYQLHTYEYSVPPNKDPHEAVRAGMDFLVNMGDSLALEHSPAGAQSRCAPLCNIRRRSYALPAIPRSSPPADI